MCENKGIKVLLENGDKKIDFKMEGFSNSKTFVKQLFDQFLDTLEDESENKKVDFDDSDVVKAIENAYLGVNQAIRQDENLDVFKPVSKGIVIHDSMGHVESGVACDLSDLQMKKIKIEKDNSIDFPSTDLDKYNKEFPKLKDAVSRNLYEKLTQLQINQLSYFVTDKGDLKLQARYSCRCGNFAKHWVAYPHGKKSARCPKCSKQNTLVPVKGEFPSTDDFGNFYVTSNMLKKQEEKENNEKGSYISMF